MAIFSHITALSLLRVSNDNLAQNGPERFDRSVEAKYLRASIKSSEVKGPTGEEIARVKTLINNPTSELHVVTSFENRVNRKGVICHTVSPSGPAQECIALKEGIKIVTPEELLLQLTQQSSFVQALKYAYEFCGCYSLPASPSHRPNLIKVSPATTPQQIRDYLATITKKRGKRTASEITKYVLPFSASPMETVLAIMFVLPKKRGGYALPLPQLNYPISCRNKNGTEERFFLDMFWPEYKLAVEYDSDEHHFGDLGAAYHDADRRMQLKKMGIDVLVITKGQIASLNSLDRAVQVIKNRMSKRSRLSDPEYAARREELLSKLLPKRRFIGDRPGNSPSEFVAQSLKSDSHAAFPPHYETCPETRIAPDHVPSAHIMPSQIAATSPSRVRYSSV